MVEIRILGTKHREKERPDLFFSLSARIGQRCLDFFPKIVHIISVIGHKFIPSREKVKD
jgi:hypothetical protein